MERIVRKTFERTAHPKEFTQPSRTHQSFKDECDITKIVNQFREVGTIEHTNQATPKFFQNFDPTLDLHSMRIIVDDANEAFEDMPASIRKRFNNNPAELVAFMDDSANTQEAIDLGLVTDPDTPAEPETAPANPVPTETPIEPTGTETGA